MKKITFVLGSMGRGGAERVISILSQNYAARGYSTDILLLLSNDVEYELHPNTRIFDFSGNPEKSRFRRLPYWLKSIRNYVRQQHPDAVVSFAARINIIVMTALTGFRQKILVSERNDPYCDGRSGLVDIAAKLLYPKAGHVVFQTRRAASYFPYLKNSVIIPNPIRTDCQAENTNVNKIVTAGRLTGQKNQKMLIDAFAVVSARHPDAFLEIYGCGELEQRLKDQISRLSLENRVFLCGNVSNLHERIADAAVFCLSSDYEGLSNALLEAMMMGLPCISTNCAGADEYIRDGENGYLTETGNCAQFADALEKLLSDERKRTAFSRQCRKDSFAFSAEQVIREWDKVILGEEEQP